MNGRGRRPPGPFLPPVAKQPLQRRADENVVGAVVEQAHAVRYGPQDRLQEIGAFLPPLLRLLARGDVEPGPRQHALGAPVAVDERRLVQEPAVGPVGAPPAVLHGDGCTRGGRPERPEHAPEILRMEPRFPKAGGRKVVLGGESRHGFYPRAHPAVAAGSVPSGHVKEYGQFVQQGARICEMPALGRRLGHRLPVRLPERPGQDREDEAFLVGPKLDVLADAVSQHLREQPGKLVRQFLADAVAQLRDELASCPVGVKEDPVRGDTNHRIAGVLRIFIYLPHAPRPGLRPRELAAKPGLSQTRKAHRHHSKLAEVGVHGRPPQNGGGRCRGFPGHPTRIGRDAKGFTDIRYGCSRYIPIEKKMVKNREKRSWSALLRAGTLNRDGIIVAAPTSFFGAAWGWRNLAQGRRIDIRPIPGRGMGFTIH